MNTLKFKKGLGKGLSALLGDTKSKTNISFELNKGAIINNKLSILIIIKICNYSRGKS